MNNIHNGEVGPTEFLAQCEATDALMAVLCEYDALWDGTLFLEILDAEVYDCTSERFIVNLPEQLCLQVQVQPDFIVKRDRIEALNIHFEVIKCYVGTNIDAPLFSEEVDASMYDCPLAAIDYQQPFNWPSPQSFK